MLCMRNIFNPFLSLYIEKQKLLHYNVSWLRPLTVLVKISMERRNTMSKLRPRPQKNYPNYNWDDLDRTIQTILSDPLYKVCHIDPSLYAIPKDEIISECISAGYTVEECEDGILNIS